MHPQRTSDRPYLPLQQAPILLESGCLVSNENLGNVKDPKGGLQSPCDKRTARDIIMPPLMTEPWATADSHTEVPLPFYCVSKVGSDQSSDHV